MVASVLVEVVYRISEEYSVEDVEALYVTCTNAENDEVFVFLYSFLYFEVLSFNLEVNKVFCLREEEVLCASYCVESV